MQQFRENYINCDVEIKRLQLVIMKVMAPFLEHTDFPF